MTSPRVQATQLVAIAVLKDLISIEEKRIRAELEAGTLPGERVIAAVEDDTVITPIGAVTAKKKDPGGKVTAQVADEEALLAWLTEHCPSEVHIVPEHTVPEVRTPRASFLPMLLDAVAKDGGWINKETGELLDVDGVETSLTGPSGGGLMVTKADGASDLIRAAITSGAFNVADVLALPASA